MPFSGSYLLLNGRLTMSGIDLSNDDRSGCRGQWSMGNPLLKMPCSATNIRTINIRISFSIYKAGRRPA